MQEGLLKASVLKSLGALFSFSFPGSALDGIHVEPADLSLQLLNDNARRAWCPIDLADKPWE